ncbi:MAG TPA: hypothetical protein VK467_04255, partial [Gemmatimonadales bacterium]|nr:hypothetical protein [Gemmatimonadales bacterium]
SCLEERPRPGPPLLTFTLEKTTVQSNNPPTPPDTLSGTVRAEDTDGLDSVWVTVDSAVAGEDGGFDRVFSAPFRFLIGAGKTPGTVLSVQLRARDIAGFQVIRDTSVTVVP